MKNILIDSCFWIALYYERDGNHNIAKQTWKALEDYNLILPFPTLYEFIDTRFVKRIDIKESFNKVLKNPKNFKIGDVKYKDNAIFKLFESNYHTYSLVDLIIREMILDTNLNINGLITYNKKDFLDVCSIRNVEIYSG